MASLNITIISQTKNPTNVGLVILKYIYLKLIIVDRLAAQTHTIFWTLDLMELLLAYRLKS